MKSGFRRWRRLGVLAAALACFAILATPGAFGQGDVGPGDAEVTVGSNDLEFSQNKQNEPALAVDANHPMVLAAGANDNIDMELCNAGDDTTCPFTDGVGVSGISFSLDGGHTWDQPTYTGYSARGCAGVVGDDPGCTPEEDGPIGTLPWYFENGLVADGDPALAFGPVPGSDGSFSWTNGSRLYYANLTSNFQATRRPDQTFKGFEAIYVSRTDDAEAAAADDKDAWEAPVRVSKQSSATFADKEQIWADNAASSQFFGNVYVCWANFTGSGAAPLVVARSTNGGDTWSQKNVSPAHNVAPKHFGQSGCTVRTDSQGVVYVFYEEFVSTSVGLPPLSKHMLVKSSDGGVSWTRPRKLYNVVDPCFHVDPTTGRCVEDGVAGARNDLAASPSADISNGAPLGGDATDQIVVSWADGRDGENHEHVMVSYSNDGGNTFSSPQAIETAGDRGYYAAPAISPNGTEVYVVYNAFTTPYQPTTATPRALVGVVKQASASDVLNGPPTTWTEVHRGVEGDPRNSSQNNLVAEFLGDYVYAVATRTYGAAVWNDTRETVDCPDMDAWRQQNYEEAAGGLVAAQDEDVAEARREQEEEAQPAQEGELEQPAPNNDCLPTWGNSDIWAWTSAPEE
jgi:hypothetical protein